MAIATGSKLTGFEDHLESEPPRWKVFLYWILNLEFLVSFYDWSYSRYASLQDFSCPPYLQSCSSLKFFQALPEGYSQNIFYTLILCVWMYGSINAVRGNWFKARISFWIMTAWKMIALLILSWSIPENFEYFHLVFVFLFLSKRANFRDMKIAFVALYLMSAVQKFDDSWISGAYFRSLVDGMPLVPFEVTPLFSLAVIFLEMFGSWFLLSENKSRNKIALYAFILFHIYSVFLVGWRYPIHIFPKLFLFFFPSVFNVFPEKKKRTKIGLGFFFALIFLQIVPQVFNPSMRYDHRLDRIGVGMFDANHQCITRWKELDHLGFEVKKESSHNFAMSRCKVYLEYFRLKQNCHNFKKITFDFFHSVNGGPLYQMVNQVDVCSTDYHWPASNDWIITSEDEMSYLGYPSQNVVYDSYPGVEINSRPVYYQSELSLFLSQNESRIVLILWVGFVISILIGTRLFII